MATASNADEAAIERRRQDIIDGRKALGLSIRGMARLAEVDHSYLSRYEAGTLDNEPHMHWIRAVSQAIGRRLAEIQTQKDAS